MTENIYPKNEKDTTITAQKKRRLLSYNKINKLELSTIRNSPGFYYNERNDINLEEFFQNSELTGTLAKEETKQYRGKDSNDSSSYNNGLISYRNFNKYLNAMMLNNSLQLQHTKQKKNLFVNDFENLSIEIDCVESSKNYQGNYHNYVSKTLKSIIPIRKLNFSDILEEKKIILTEQQNNLRKILILDLDETLIHADFDLNYTDHDDTISFEFQGESVSAPIILRPGLHEFLRNISKIFDVYVFTASKREYADAILDYLDSNGEIFKRRFYRENCINIKNKFFIKDLRMFGNCKLEDIIIVDNSLYSFANQLSNGCLISSFYNDKQDRELFTLFNYLKNFVSECKDIRSVNEKIFNFSFILEEYISNPLCRDY